MSLVGRTVDVIDPVSDPRIKHCTADLNGRTYHYLLAVPKGGYRNTIFLIHGWPDISMGWRYQIPALLGMGLRIVCPDLMGFGRTDAPESLSDYGYKRVAGDLKELARQLGASRIFLGGHDWGGAVVYRVTLWQPELIIQVFSVCTPYLPPSKAPFLPLAELVRTKLPNFGYQLQLASGEVEKKVHTKEQIKQFLNIMYGGRGPNGEAGFDVNIGLLYDRLPGVGPSPLLTSEELNYYTDEYARHGLHGTLNWYRTSEINYNEDQGLPTRIIEVPVLFIQATKDAALTPAMSAGMDAYIPNLTRKEVETGHWALWQAPELVNSMIKGWLESANDATDGRSSL